MNPYPKITIITPSLNQGKFIEETILSILSQGYPNLEYIIADGGSTDETIPILKKFAPKIIWTSKKDGGQTQAINSCLQQATGEIISYLNSDDILLPGTLFKIASVFNSHPTKTWVTGYCVNINENSHEIRQMVTIYKKLLLESKYFNFLIMTNFISQAATFWRKDVTSQIGLLDEKLKYAMDYDFWLRLWKNQSPILLRANLAGFRIHAKSKTTSAGISHEYIEEEYQVIRKYSKSKFWLVAHDAHRKMMTYIYSTLNSG